MIRWGSYVATVEEEIMSGPKQVRYYLLANEDANYVGMATAYRDHLIEEHNIQPKGRCAGRLCSAYFRWS